MEQDLFAGIFQHAKDLLKSLVVIVRIRHFLILSMGRFQNEADFYPALGIRRQPKDILVVLLVHSENQIKILIIVPGKLPGPLVCNVDPVFPRDGDRSDVG